ncbi:decaprenyl-phosphate phosphoribosyltransferase [Methanobacterium movens]
MRPKQWYKNLILFVGLIFSNNLLEISSLIDSTSAFIIFCALSGSIYIINDIIDKEKDLLHPLKSQRPIASGILSEKSAIISSLLILILSLVVAYSINLYFLWISILFFVIILAYSIYLKNLVIVDIIVISSGFVIRAIAGCLAISVFVSPWLIICTFLLALLLALGKRRHEIIILGEEGINHRAILANYSEQMLDQMINITTSSLIISYSLYTFFHSTIYLMLTIPFAFYGIFRYILLVNKKNMGGEPELLFKDKGMVMSMVLWVLIILIIIYIPQ